MHREDGNSIVRRRLPDGTVRIFYEMSNFSPTEKQKRPFHHLSHRVCYRVHYIGSYTVHYTLHLWIVPSNPRNLSISVTSPAIQHSRTSLLPSQTSFVPSVVRFPKASATYRDQNLSICQLSSFISNHSEPTIRNQKPNQPPTRNNHRPPTSPATSDHPQKQRTPIFSIHHQQMITITQVIINRSPSSDDPCHPNHHHTRSSPFCSEVFP